MQKIIDLSDLKTRNKTSLYCYEKESQNIDDVIMCKQRISIYKHHEKAKWHCKKSKCRCLNEKKILLIPNKK